MTFFIIFVMFKLFSLSNTCENFNQIVLVVFLAFVVFIMCRSLTIAKIFKNLLFVLDSSLQVQFYQNVLNVTGVKLNFLLNT